MDIKPYGLKMNKIDETLVLSRQQGDWYRGESCNFLVDKNAMSKGKESVEKYILPGLVPENPFINKKMGIAAFGSCFAAEMTRCLRQWGYNIDPLFILLDNPIHTHVTYHGSGIVNTSTILQQFEWAYTNKIFKEDIWYNRPEYAADNDEKTRQDTKLLFDHTDVFIITFGLSEVWYHKESGEVFWRAVPKHIFDPQKHGFRVCSVSETIDNIENTIQIIRQNRPHSCIIFTLSPVKLLATFRPIGCSVANCVSKAIIRTALDEVLRNHIIDSNLFYWPSYEIVTETYPVGFSDDNRHPIAAKIKIITELFKQYYLIEENSND